MEGVFAHSPSEERKPSQNMGLHRLFQTESSLLCRVEGSSFAVGHNADQELSEGENHGLQPVLGSL